MSEYDVPSDRGPELLAALAAEKARADAAAQALARKTEEAQAHYSLGSQLARQLTDFRAQLAAAHEGQVRLREALQLDKPWPVADVLVSLADATEHLLTVHDCDHLGWEVVTAARDEARQIVRSLAALKASAPVASPPSECNAFAHDATGSRWCCTRDGSHEGDHQATTHDDGPILHQWPQAVASPSGWQPIETAPKDSTCVLLWEPSAPLRHDGIVLTGSFVDFSGDKVPDGYHSGWFDDVNGHYEIQPTHWQPLPAPPVASQAPNVEK